MGYEHAKLQEKHHEVLRLLTLGKKDVWIAERLGITTATVQNLKHGTLGGTKLSVLQGERDSDVFDVIQEAKQHFRTALETLTEINAKNDDGTLRYKASDARAAAMDILGLGGVAPVKRLEVKKQTALGVFSAEDLQEFKAAHMKSCNLPSEEEVVDV